jgi:hypothetical protein
LSYGGIEQQMMMRFCFFALFIEEVWNCSADALLLICFIQRRSLELLSRCAFAYLLYSTQKFGID